LIDLAGGQITVANAGHLPPLLLYGDEGDFVQSHIGVPVGVASGSAYAPVTVAVPANATLLAFTDGLVERRGESLDVGLERLRDIALVAGHRSLDGLLSTLVNDLIGDGSDDDAVVLGLRWRS
jgi:serine phosphatase RsbU (regulator of sigma subunit)